LGDSKLGQRAEGQRPEPLDWRNAPLGEEAIAPAPPVAPMAPESSARPATRRPKASRRKVDPVNVPKLVRFRQKDIDRLEQLIAMLKERSPALPPSEAALIRGLIYLAVKMNPEDLLDAAVPGWRQANDR
jgi:hypothetical protein